MNQVIQTIFERRAVRKFKDKKVEKALIGEIIEAGRMAPSAINLQPWKFYILTDGTLISQFSKETARAAAKSILRSGLKNVARSFRGMLHFSHGLDFFKTSDPIFHGAPVVIFLTSPKDSEWAPLDIGMCAQNIMLAAKSMGLDTCPVGLGKYAENTSLYSKLNIPSSEHINLAIILGYGDEKPEVHERRKDNAFYL